MDKVVVFCVLVLSSICSAKAECTLSVYESGVGEADLTIIVDKHNALRLQLAQGNVSGQPRAIDMKRMSYDEELAQAAQDIANTCNFQHVTVHHSNFTWVGQNLFMSMSSSCVKGANWNGAVQNWFDEYKKYVYPSNAASNTGHYTQVAWAYSFKIGCGYILFEDSGKYKCKKMYVCNYGPGGNIQGQAPYKTGTSGCENLC